MAKKKSGESKIGGVGEGMKLDSILPMLSGFTVLRMTSMMSMVDISMTKEELLAMNKKLNKIRKPKNKKK